MYKIFVLGIAEQLLTQKQQDLLADCAAIVCTNRFRNLVEHFDGKILAITPIDRVFGEIRRELSAGNVAVLASGDPLFYGLGRRLLTEFDDDQLEFLPALSSLQRACALFKLPWDDARITSLHGRSHPHLPGLLLGHAKNIVFTDSTNSPDRIAGLLHDYLQSVGDVDMLEEIRMLVAENIGLDGEKLFSGTLAEGKHSRFSPLNVLCLLAPAMDGGFPCRFGLREEDISHSRGLITKNEVRAATLHSLQLPAEGILWDVGAGSGSLSIEAARSTPGLTVYAIEHKAEELKNIKRNIVKFRCHNIVPVFGRAPQSLAELPAPDRVFIGGSGGALVEIVADISARLAVDGRLVINGVLDKTVRQAPQLMRQHGFTVETSVVKVNRSAPDGALQEFNPITIMAGTR
ncbi:MAG: precorrin-6y C5,15-methyltransferase (decarboxylating) subunit CbiE [Desulforhopalus sp.]